MIKFKYIFAHLKSFLTTKHFKYTKVSIDKKDCLKKIDLHISRRYKYFIRKDKLNVLSTCLYI